jgi:hypothetical protein
MDLKRCEAGRWLPLFATPYHAWERGLNENTNGPIRDFFPKGTDFSTIANAEVAKVERLPFSTFPGARASERPPRASSGSIEGRPIFG